MGVGARWPLSTPIQYNTGATRPRLAKVRVNVAQQKMEQFLSLNPEASERPASGGIPNMSSDDI